MKKIKFYVSKLHAKGFSSIVLTSILSNIVTFVGGIILVRILPKSEYGNYVYALNVYSMLVIVGDLGISSATLQFVSENFKIPSKANAYIAYALKMLVILSAIPIAIVGTSYIWYPYTIGGVGEVVGSLMLVPFFQNLNLFLLVLLRAHLKNNWYAIANIINCVLHYLFIILFAYKGGWSGAVISKYPTTIIMTIVCILFVKGTERIGESDYILQRSEKVAFLKLAFVTQANAISSTLMNLLDVYCVGLFIADSSAIASYKTASVLPTALNFIPQSVMLFMVPYFGRSAHDKKWVAETYKKVWIGSLAICIIVACVGMLSASFVIPLLFGKEYRDAIPCYIVLLVGFICYGGLQCPATNVLYTQRKLKAILFMTVFGALGNTLLNILLIKHYGSLGASFATMIMHMIVGILANVYLHFVLKKKYYRGEKNDSK